MALGCGIMIHKATHYQLSVISTLSCHRACPTTGGKACVRLAGTMDPVEAAEPVTTEWVVVLDS